MWADESVQAIRVGDKTGRLSANEFLEDETKKFLDDKLKARVKHVQFRSIAVIPRAAGRNTTNIDIDWEMEESVLILFEEEIQ